MIRVAADNVLAQHPTAHGWSVAIVRRTDTVRKVAGKLVPCVALEVCRVHPDGTAIGVGGLHLTEKAAKAAANKLWLQDR